jgi:hypothetical protein
MRTAARMIRSSEHKKCHGYMSLGSSDGLKTRTKVNVAWFGITEATMISFAAPRDPPTMHATKLGAMAMHLVSKFLNQSFIFKSKKP